MGKINKKHNQQIKMFFKGLAFEEGITQLTLKQLQQVASLFDDQRPPLDDRDGLIRFLRRIWSNNDLEARREIVSFLIHGGLENLEEKRNMQEKQETISHILEDTSYTHKELEQLTTLFANVKNRKITKEKLLSRLQYLRKKEYYTTLEKSLNVSFDSSNQMLWYHPFVFRVDNQDFSKFLLCATQLPFELDESNLELSLLELKNKTNEEKQNQIDGFIKEYLTPPHPYLKREEIILSLKSMPPEALLIHAPIPFEVLEQIVQSINPRYFLTQSTEHLIIEKEKKQLFLGVSMQYRISVSYTKDFLYKLIWQGEALPIADDLTQVNERLLEDLGMAFEEIVIQMQEAASGLKITRSSMESFIFDFFEPQVFTTQTLKLREKTKRRILYHWNEYLRPFKEKQKREELLAKTIRDFKLLFPLARELKRKIIFHVGPTNSGKTYTALEKLKAATTGYYLAPLRLLALEGYETLQKDGVKISLITGEEEILHEDSTHVSSTIEMMNSQVPVDVCVIDEIQMIKDRDRGWAWANALIGIPAKLLILTGSWDAVNAVKELAAYLEEEIEIIPFERKNPLETLEYPIPLTQIEKQTAIVAFSRREVLALKQQLTSKYNVSVVYGNLSPEVRREEARRFRTQESEILIATDAIAMGLNLPIKTILFAKDNKFDGLRRRELEPSEVLQIAGRAGRYGIQEKGFVGAIDSSTLATITKALATPLQDIDLPVSVMASLEHVLLIGEILDTENLSPILEFFTENMEFEGPFVAANIDSMLEIAVIVDEYKLNLRTRYHLACAPASISSPYIESALHRFIRQIEANKPVTYTPLRDLPPFAHTNEMLLNAEERVREISLYLWLSFRFEGLFPDTKLAIQTRGRLNSFIETSLKHGHFVKECHRCGKILDFSYRFSICDACHAKGKRGEKLSWRKRR